MDINDGKTKAILINIFFAAMTSDEAEAKQLLCNLGEDGRKELLQTVERIEDYIADVEGWYESPSASEVENRVAKRSSEMDWLRKELERES
jgi:hypothetical protein